MADVIDYKIYGDDLQLVEVELDPNEGIRAEIGTMTYMEDGIEMQTDTGGTVIEKDLAAGEHLRVDTGCIVAFSTTVDYDIKFVGGFKNALFGGEGLFLASLQGPGKVYLQSLPFSRLVDRIKRGITFGQRGGEQKGVAGLGGNILKDIISGGVILVTLFDSTSRLRTCPGLLS